MTTITKEFTQAIIKGHGYGVAPSAVEALARIALASLEAEPVAYLNRFTGRSFELEQQPGADKDPTVYIPLYAAMPSPVVSAEIRNGLKAEAMAELLKDAHDYAPLTAEQWETLVNNWHQTFMGLGEGDSCAAAGGQQ
ncbi:hypothetical protein [Edwardsiella tarda]